MKITKEQLKQIIKEELEAVMEAGGRSEVAEGFISNKEPARKPILSMGRVEKALKKELGREPSEEEVSTKYAELKATGKYRELGSGPFGRKAESITEGHREKTAAMAEKIKQTDGWVNMQPWHSKAELDLEDFEIDDIASSLEMMEGYEEVAQFLRDMIGSRWR